MNNRHIFQIGEEVIALNNPIGSSNQPRIKGQKYTILDINYCSRCGVQSINVSGKLSNEMDPDIYFCTCGISFHPRGLWWTRSTFFIRPEDIPAAIEAAEQVEDYETCITLRDLV